MTTSSVFLKDGDRLSLSPESRLKSTRLATLLSSLEIMSMSWLLLFFKFFETTYLALESESLTLLLAEWDFESLIISGLYLRVCLLADDTVCFL